MFAVGKKVVYPSHGVATVEGIEKKAIFGEDRVFYVLRVDGNGMVIMVPEENLDKIGVRGVIAGKDVAKVMRILREQGRRKVLSNWNRRHKEYMERIQTGSVFEIAKVYRELSRLKLRKELSFGEQKVLDNARQLIVSEIAEAKGVAQSKVERMIDKVFS